MAFSDNVILTIGGFLHRPVVFNICGQQEHGYKSNSSSRESALWKTHLALPICSKNSIRKMKTEIFFVQWASGMLQKTGCFCQWFLFCSCPPEKKNINNPFVCLRALGMAWDRFRTDRSVPGSVPVLPWRQQDLGEVRVFRLGVLLSRVCRSFITSWDLLVVERSVYLSASCSGTADVRWWTNAQIACTKWWLRGFLGGKSSENLREEYKRKSSSGKACFSPG